MSTSREGLFANQNNNGDNERLIAINIIHQKYQAQRAALKNSYDMCKAIYQDFLADKFTQQLFELEATCCSDTRFKPDDISIEELFALINSGRLAKLDNKELITYFKDRLSLTLPLIDLFVQSVSPENKDYFNSKIESNLEAMQDQQGESFGPSFVSALSSLVNMLKSIPEEIEYFYKKRDTELVAELVNILKTILPAENPSAQRGCNLI